MALGDGIRRNIATVSPEERRRLRDAFIALNSRFFAGNPEDQQDGHSVPGHVSFWYKQDEIHARTGVHGSPVFLPWHRELCNRLEQMLREVDAELSLHYWDWTTDPQKQQAPDGTTFSLFTEDFMGAAQGSMGPPWENARFYDPNANPARDSDPFNPDPHEDPNYNAAFPPVDVRRGVQSGPPAGLFAVPFDDEAIKNAPDYVDMERKLEGSHGNAHGYIGGNLGHPHASFRDPFVFLLHSNADRLWALWQLQPGHPERLDPDQAYGAASNSVASPRSSSADLSGIIEDGFLIPDRIRMGIMSPLLPWSGNELEINVQSVLSVQKIVPVRPWAPPENEHVGYAKNSRHPTVVKPPHYDTNP